MRSRHGCLYRFISERPNAQVSRIADRRATDRNPDRVAIMLELAAGRMESLTGVLKRELRRPSSQSVLRSVRAFLHNAPRQGRSLTPRQGLEHGHSIPERVCYPQAPLGPRPAAHKSKRHLVVGLSTPSQAHRELGSRLSSRRLCFPTGVVGHPTISNKQCAPALEASRIAPTSFAKDLSHHYSAGAELLGRRCRRGTSPLLDEVFAIVHLRHQVYPALGKRSLYLQLSSGCLARCSVFHHKIAVLPENRVSPGVSTRRTIAVFDHVDSALQPYRKEGELRPIARGWC